MNARTHVYSLLVQAGIAQNIAEEALADLDALHAHQHAERIRDNADDPRNKKHLSHEEWLGMKMAANLLAPDPNPKKYRND